MSENGSALEARESVAKAMGAKKAFGERFTLYLPNKGRAENESEKQIEIPNWDSWVRRALDILGNINGGATAASPATGLYIDDERSREVVWEKTILVYSFINRESFHSRIEEVRAFAHEFGRETRQGSVFFEFDGYAYQIDSPYDARI